MPEISLMSLIFVYSEVVKVWHKIRNAEDFFPNNARKRRVILYNRHVLVNDYTLLDNICGIYDANDTFF